VSDPAIDTALDILDGTICECGHMDTEHVGLESDAGRISYPCEQLNCKCVNFTAVDFMVTRASEVSE